MRPPDTDPPAPAAAGGAFVCCGIRIDAITLDSAADLLAQPAPASPRAVHLCNAYTLSLALKDPRLSAALNRGDLNVPDGMPLVWLARRLGLSHMQTRVYGPDLMLAVMDRGRRYGLRHHLYGSTPDVVAMLASRLRQRLPGVEIVGTESPPFGPLTLEQETMFLESVARSQADIVWVGLGTPRQDEFVDALGERAGCTLVAVGAAFDFHAGTKRQAPRWLQRNGLEWAFRLALEPRRLWRRYMVGNVVFACGALRSAHLVRAADDR